MATANLFWSSPASSSSPPELIPEDPHRQLPDADPKETSSPPSKPKSGAAGRGNKRTQRSPGVAQLERLRVQEGITRLSGPNQAREIPLIYGVPVKRFASATGVWLESLPPAAGFFYRPGTLVGTGSRSLLQEQYSLDRHRIATAGSVYQRELPSNQSVLCISQHCKLCALHRKGINAGEYLPIDLNTAPPVNQGGSVRGGYPVAKMEVTEYHFFPHKITSEAAGGDSEFVNGNHLVGEGSAHFFDLSLNL